MASLYVTEISHLCGCTHEHQLVLRPGDIAARRRANLEIRLCPTCKPKAKADGRRLHDMRLGAGLQLAVLAALAGTSRVMLRDAEAGEVLVGADLWARLLDAITGDRAPTPAAI